MTHGERKRTESKISWLVRDTPVWAALGAVRAFLGPQKLPGQVRVSLEPA
jgi:hypothetical protein